MTKNRQTILIVDDERFNINVLKGLLDADYDTMVARNGVQALERVKSATLPDLILLDIMMPQMDGYAVCQRLKEAEATREIPVIFVTSMAEVGDETKGFKLGAVDYITKPVSPPVVLARVKTHLALKQSLQVQKDLNTLKNKFLGIAAHDLRNPLTSILGLSELMMKIPLSEEKKTRFVATIHRVSNQMLRLVNDLLDVSVIESGRFDLRLEKHSLSQLAAERAELVADSARNKGIELTMDLPEITETLFDTDRIGQVVDNMLSNAIKFSQSGTTIHLASRETGGWVEVAVTDQGPGIPEEEFGNLFGAFKKLSVQPTGGEKSIGLGLSIVKKIVDAHGGDIRVESAVGKGTTFTVSLLIKAGHGSNQGNTR